MARQRKIASRDPACMVHWAWHTGAAARIADIVAWVVVANYILSIMRILHIH